jgi:hypothetical protein
MVLNRNQPDFQEQRFVEFKQNMNAADVLKWRSSFFDGARDLFDTSDDTQCVTTTQILTGPGAILDAFEEDYDKVDAYHLRNISMATEIILD